MSHTPTLERISQALEPIFPIELRFTDYTRPEAGRAPAAGSLYHLFVISRRFEGLPKIDRHDRLRILETFYRSRYSQHQYDIAGAERISPLIFLFEAAGA